MSMFRNIPYIPTSEELADIVFSNLKKVRIDQSRKRRSKLSFYKTLYFRQLRALFNDLEERLTFIVESFPNIDELHPFHRDLLDILFGEEKLRIALSRIDNIQRSLESIRKDVFRKLGRSEDPNQARRIRQEALGRTGSAIRDISKSLEVLIDAKIELSHIPDFSLKEKTIAFAGAPNVGKSSFVKLVSSGRPEIASYPFTTRELICGHGKYGYERFQLVDTPGLLDRPLSQRNDIEMRSIIAIRYLADLIIYLFDPTEQSVLTLTEQLNLLEEIKTTFSEIPIISYINKKDIISDERLAEVRQKVGDLPAIATIESNKDELEDVLLNALERISQKAPLFRKERLKSARKTREKEQTKEKDEIEWIFLDESD
ncbi:MAG: hypothetical protein GF308_01795 [Candidatus Heimdallarchaeota archaeon]|nr:hypothetical protein [Candidatus Heimdallarchaeota archaeon]